MRLSPDEIIFWQYGFFKLNATIVFTWGLMLVLAVGSKLITRKTFHRPETFPLAEPSGNRRHRHRATDRRGRPESAEEVSRLSGHALPVCRRGQPLHHHSRLRAADWLALDHGGTRAVRVCGRAVLRHRGARVGNYLKSYVKPTFIMLPFNIISELSRTLALAVRLFGNMMSGAMIIAILLTITPFIFPIIMTALGLLTGMVQAYIFSILAAVYIAAATRVRKPKAEVRTQPLKQNSKQLKEISWIA
jgi:F-type H+-transporting ATPase subunit a